MRFLIPLLLLASLAGFSQAEEQLRQLPSGSTAVEVQGQTLYQHGNTFYRFQPEGGYYYEVKPPAQLLRSEQPHFYRRSFPEHQAREIDERQIGGREEGCRNMAGDIVNRTPSASADLYAREYNRCMNLSQ